MALFCYRWGDANVQWNVADWTWAECQLVSDIIGGFSPGAPPAFPDWLREDKKDDEKQKRFIRLLCKVKGIPLYDEKKEVRSNIIVNAKDVELVVKAVAGIDVIITEE